MRAAWTGAFDYACELLGTSAERQVSPERSALRWVEVALYAAGAGQQVRAVKALEAARVVHAIDVAKEPTVAFKAAILAALAAASADPLSGRVRTLLDAAGDPPDARLGSLAAAVKGLIRGASGLDVIAMLEDLWAHDLGGFALVFAALPPIGWTRI